MKTFIWGAVAMGYLVAGFFFARFRVLTQERLFGFFSAAFFVLAIDQTLLAFTDPEHDERYQLYVVRLAAFIILIVGILDKNRRAKRGSPPP